MFSRKSHKDAQRKSHKDAQVKLAKSHKDAQSDLMNGARIEAWTGGELLNTNTPGTNGKAARIAATEPNSTQGREQMLGVENAKSAKPYDYAQIINTGDTRGYGKPMADWQERNLA